ncbi:type II toxin-antitoxin system HicA family toxin [Desulfosporosinus sp. PR]|uniref:type II toxin-antitoxin system HicA family toxin n=1 Tax=Candidatus Desulfosporosinus nitrosoreducens TaxID=3401928 RepID=UPI0027F56641|nr:type II toxin-antitoxin system HicA family toxin [Desulfosporosinus sp. PR]MDQ7093634.1 type II toxin-antitoxin system HicA family toxin [Desulfosporosinus sp. PR]
MAKRDKLIDRLLQRPTNFEYDETRSLLIKLGYRENNRGRTSGLRVAFIKDETGFVIRIHKPHQGEYLRDIKLIS